MSVTQPKGALLDVVTPEGVPLRFEIAPAGARAGGVILDYLILIGGLLCLWIGAGLTGLAFSSILAQVVLVLLTFLAVHFYFTIFELRWQGATPGKRMMRTRVINRLGGPVTGEAILTRNFLRIVEIFIPVEFVTMWSSGSLSELPWYLVLGALLWVFLLTFLPLFNRQRMRLGDLAAGTVVVRNPKTALLGDMSEEARRRDLRARYAFEREHLEAYGEYELQVLEELLRSGRGASHAGTYMDVADRIAKKIRWGRRIRDTEAQDFLRAYYNALREHRERRLLFGRRKQDKHAKEL
ncbi:MAG: RDD family protein [Planctomycetota bacterium]|nr:RDD family protein [Planctomycetota bacterium]